MPPSVGAKLGVEVRKRPEVVTSFAQAVQAGQHSSGAFDVLVLDAGTRQSLACARSLGRAGLRVALGERVDDCDSSQRALAFHSRYSAHNVVLPSVVPDANAFGAAVVAFVRDNPTRVVVPTGDAVIGAMAPRRGELAALGCVLALTPDAALDIASDKDRTLEIARELGIAYPRSTLIDSLDQIPEVLAEFQFPFVLKPTASSTPHSAARLLTVEVVDEAEATSVIRKFLAAGVSCLAQEWAGGRREGVMLFMVDGDVRASCAHAAHRTVPALGGASVMRETIPLPLDFYEASCSLAKAVGIEGPCDVEFRRDAADRPLLMEINARLGGTTENAIRAGVDFPLLLWQWASGQPVDRVEGYKVGVRTRWLRGDMRWLRDNHRRVGRPDSVSRARALGTFATEFVRTRYYDGLDWRDLGPAVAEMRTTALAIKR
jgi:predicted ATP-grasp superfamily ATP-dependent carboligase